MRALVVDDSRAMRRIVGNILRTGGFEVNEAGNGREALAVLESLEEPPELACIDWNMPVMDGLELVVAIRERKEWRDITLMMVTTESEQDRIVRALAAGAHEYLTKPFESQDLWQKLVFLGLVREPAMEM